MQRWQIIPIFLYCMSCYANDEVLGPEPNATAQLQPISKHDLGLQLGLEGALGLATHKLTSVGYNVSLPPKFSNSFDVWLAYTFPFYPDLSLEGKFVNQVSVFDQVGTTPSTITVNSKSYEAILDLMLSPFWCVGVGLFTKERSATNTSPQNAISSAFSSGPILLVGYNYYIDQKTQIRSRLSGLFQNYYRETSSSSGITQFAFTARVQVKYKREIKKRIFWGAGFKMEYEESIFSGTGDRQTTNAREQLIKYYVPLYIEVAF